MSFAIVASVASTVVGAALSSDSSSDAQGAINQSNEEANRLAREQFEYQKQIQAPYQQAGTGALGMITNGLGIAPQIETREQIRARLSQQQNNNQTNTQPLPQNNGISQYGNSGFAGILNGLNGTANNPNQRYGTGNLSWGIYTNLTPEEAEKLEKAKASLGFSNANFQAGAVGSDQGVYDNYKRVLEAAGLADKRLDYLNTTDVNYLRKKVSQIARDDERRAIVSTGNDLDAQVEAEYARQQQANQSATGSSGFGDFNRDFTAEDFDVNKDPSAKFRQDQANKALARTYAGSGNFFSGGALKGISAYNQEFASQEFGNAYNRFNADRDRRFNRLATVAGIGQTANTATGNASQNYANSVGENITNTGSANASATLYGGRQLNNAVQGGFAQLSNQIPRIGNYFEQQRLSGYGGTTADPWYG